MITKDVSFKLIVLGESRVGKTSLMLRYVRNEFDEGQISTTDATNLEKKIKLDETSVRIFIWDTAGQEEYHALNTVYYRDAAAAILVYDITDRDSFDKVQTWVEELRLYLPKDTPIAIAGNKYDLPNRAVDKDEVEDYAKDIGGVHFDTSAKTGKGVNDIFEAIAKAVIRKNKRMSKKKQEGRKSKRKSRKANFGIEGDDDDNDVQLGQANDEGYGGIRLTTYQSGKKKKKKK